MLNLKNKIRESQINHATIITAYHNHQKSQQTREEQLRAFYESQIDYLKQQLLVSQQAYDNL